MLNYHTNALINLDYNFFHTKTIAATCNTISTTLTSQIDDFPNSVKVQDRVFFRAELYNLPERKLKNSPKKLSGLAIWTLYILKRRHTGNTNGNASGNERKITVLKSSCQYLKSDTQRDIIFENSDILGEAFIMVDVSKRLSGSPKVCI